MKNFFTPFFIFLISAMTAFAAENGTLRIAHLCDPQIGFYKDKLYQDIEDFKAEIVNVNRLKPDLVVIAGDMVNIPDSTYHALFMDAIAGLEIPVVYTPGNHDIYDPVSKKGLEKYRRAFGDDFVVRKINGRTLISFNTQLFRKAPEDEVALQRQRLDRALAEAHKAGEPVILLSHVPPFVDNIDEKEEYFNLPIPDRKPLLDKFVANGVFIWLCGHTHKTHRNDYGPIAILNGETTSVNFDSRPKGFRMLTIAPDNTFTWDFIPNKP